LRILLFCAVEACNEVADDGITLAGGAFKALAIDNLYATPAVSDKAVPLEGSGGEGDAGAAGAEHLSKKLLRQVEVIGFETVPDHQQPAGESFFYLVEAVAGGELAEDEALALHALHDALTERRVQVEELLQVSKRHAKRGSFTLDESRGGGRGRSQKIDGFNEAFPANDADFGSKAVGHEGDDGSDAGRHEVRKRGRLAGVGEHSSHGQVDWLQVGEQRRFHLGGKSVDDQI
jgi:hypothetical protein